MHRDELETILSGEDCKGKGWEVGRSSESGGWCSWRAVSWGRMGGEGDAQSTQRVTFTFHFHALEKEMATHSSTLAWKIPWTEDPGRLQSMGLQVGGHD